MHQCPDCNGYGFFQNKGPAVRCETCDETGWLDDDGEPLYLEPELNQLAGDPAKEKTA